MNNPSADSPAPHNARFYVIRISDQLDADWSDWFDGMRISHSDDTPPHTVLSGYVRDQAELFGILYKVRGLNLTLLSVQGLDSAKEQQKWNPV